MTCHVSLEGADFGFQDQIVFLGCEVYNVAIHVVDSTKWEIYPNPNNGSELWVEGNSQSNLTIINLVGELIYTKSLYKGVNKI